MSKTILVCSAIVLLITGSIEAADKVVVIPLGGSAATDKLWGTGRPETKLLAHTDQNGYCTSVSGIKFALSYHMASWASTADVCPAGTWVCSNDDLPATDSCPLVPVTEYRYIECDGTLYPDPKSEQTLLDGWIADADPIESHWGRKRYSHNLTTVSRAKTCRSYRAWCCWR